jgi:hypothetical protein
MPDSLPPAAAGCAHYVIESSEGVRIDLHDLGGPNGGRTAAVLLFYVEFWAAGR